MPKANDKSQKRVKPYRLLQNIQRQTAQSDLERTAILTEATTSCEQLNRCQAELKRQKTLKKEFIKKEKERRRELDRVMRFSNPKTLRLAKLAAKRDGINKKIKKKDLKREYEELKVAYVVTQEQMNAELQAERDKNNALQEQLDSLRGNNTCSHQDDILATQQLIETLKQQLQLEINCHAERLYQHMQLVQAMRDEQEALRQQLSAVQVTNKAEVEMLVAQLNSQAASNLQLSAKLEDREECSPPRKRKTPRRDWEEPQRGSPSGRPQLGSPSRALRHEEDCLSGYVSDPEAFQDILRPPVETPLEKTPEPSAFKRFRHRLGLRKPENWKRKNPSS